MIIEAKFISSDIAGKLRDGAYELIDGATVASLMDAALLEAGLELTEQQRSNFVFVFDNAPAFYDTKLYDGGTLRVLFKIMGG